MTARNLINQELAHPSALSGASWVIADRITGKAIFETFNRATADKVNTANYRVVPILEWLHSLNRR